MREHHAEVVCGNHDRFVNNKEMNPDRFKWIKHYAELSDNRRKVVLCHYPIMCYNGQYRRDSEGIPVAYMLYGHVHNTFDEYLVHDSRIRRDSIGGRPAVQRRRSAFRVR